MVRTSQKLAKWVGHSEALTKWRPQKVYHPFPYARHIKTRPSIGPPPISGSLNKNDPAEIRVSVTAVWTGFNRREKVRSAAMHHDYRDRKESLMWFWKLPLAILSFIALSACGGMDKGTRTVLGATGGAAAGYAAADLLGADSDWKVIGALTGAAAGTLVARNPRTNRCAYSDGRGGYTKRRCN